MTAAGQSASPWAGSSSTPPCVLQAQEVQGSNGGGSHVFPRRAHSEPAHLKDHGSYKDQQSCTGRERVRLWRWADCSRSARRGGAPCFNMLPSPVAQSLVFPVCSVWVEVKRCSLTSKAVGFERLRSREPLFHCQCPLVTALGGAAPGSPH